MTKRKDPADIKKRGAKSSYTTEKGSEICRRLAAGETLQVICKTPGMPRPDTIWDWTQAQAEFAEMYARARIAQTRTWADEIMTIADDIQQDYLRDADGQPVLNSKGEAVYIKEMPQRTAQRIDARKWLVARINRLEYGEKVDHNVHHTFEDREDDEILAEVQNALSDAGIKPEDVIEWLRGPVQ